MLFTFESALRTGAHSGGVERSVRILLISSSHLNDHTKYYRLESQISTTVMIHNLQTFSQSSTVIPYGSPCFLESLKLFFIVTTQKLRCWTRG